MDLTASYLAFADQARSASRSFWWECCELLGPAANFGIIREGGRRLGDIRKRLLQGRGQTGELGVVSGRGRLKGGHRPLYDCAIGDGREAFVRRPRAAALAWPGPEPMPIPMPMPEPMPAEPPGMPFIMDCIISGVIQPMAAVAPGTAASARRISVARSSANRQRRPKAREKPAPLRDGGRSGPERPVFGRKRRLKARRW